MRIHIPPKRVREKFMVTYELKGCQKAVNFLTDYYRVRKMKIVLDGRRVPRKCSGFYFKNRACFRREGLKRQIVLHEVYHHLIEVNGYELKKTIEEKEADKYARDFTKENHRPRSKNQGR
jgi:hypothetical protein